MPRRNHVAVTITTEPGSLARVDMRAAKKTTENRKVLQELVPLNALSSERFDSLVEKIVIEEVKSGRYIFRKGDRDNQTIYLLAGKISLMDGFRKVSGEIEAGTEASRHPIAAQQPRPYSARVVKKAVIARIDSSLLDAFLSWDQSSTAEVADIGTDDDGDWMTRLLQSEAFRKLPPSKLQGLLMKMKPFKVKKGDVVIAEGSEGDYFYTIHEGRCAVTREDEDSGKPQLLAELGDGDSFGEDALVSNCCRNATVTMQTDGMLMRLDKQDFIDLLKTQLVRYVGFEQAGQMARDGAIWLDVRTQDEYLHGCVEGSINIPLLLLRDQLSELVFDASYIICCDSGSRSESAAFLLSHKGFEVCVLERGLPDSLMAGALPELTSGPVGAEQLAEVVELAATFTDTARPVPAADDQVTRLQADYDALRSRHEALLAEQEQRHAAEARLEEQLELLRSELGGSAGRLDELNAQVDAHAGEKQSLLDHYAGLQETHAKQLQSLQLELDQERSKGRELASQVQATARECDALKAQVAAAKQGGRTELTSLQAELSQAHARLSELEAAVESADASRKALQEESAANSEHSRNALHSQQELLNAARKDVERLSADLARVTGERQDLDREVATLKVEIAALQDATKETSGKLVEESEVVTALRAQNAEQSLQIKQLQDELAKRQSLLDSRTADHEKRIEELQQQLEYQLAESEQGYSELQSLQDELDTARSEAERLSTELAAVTEQRQALTTEIASLSGEMAALQEAASIAGGKLTEEGKLAAGLRAQNDELTRQAGQLQAELAARESQLETTASENDIRIQELQAQLEQLQVELAARESQLETTATENEARQQKLQQQLEQLQAELAARQSQLESSVAGHEQQAQELQQQIEQHLAGLQQAQEQLQAVTAEHEQAKTTIDELQQKNSQLQAAGNDASSAYEAQLKRAEGLLAERNAAAAVYAKQQAEWDQQRSALQKQADTEQEAASRLSKELEQLKSAMAETSADFEQKLQQQVEEASTVLEQKEQRFAELEQSAHETADELNLLKDEYDELKRQAEKSTSDIADLNRKIADKDAQIGASRLELSQYEVDKTVLGQELELSRQRVLEQQQAIVKFEAQVKSLEQDLQASARKAHDDLKRKNEIEKELQAQVEQQRKKLEQLTADFQKERGEAQDTIDYLRDELHSERDARDTERVEMATRQRELKEQLAAAAIANGDNVTDHSGVIEEAVDAVRAEERSRLQGVLDAHAETEQRLAKVQAELQHAHAELAEHHRQEKSRRQGDIELMAEQNRQAEAAITQLQEQLQLLTGERDNALEQQQELHEKMDSLRAEVEAARDLMNDSRQGQQEDPVQLRKQLDDTRHNVEIAVRLRAEAEAARDRLLEERDSLLEKLESGQHVSVPAREAEPSESGSRRERKKAAAASTATVQTTTQTSTQPETAPKKDAAGASRLSRRLGHAIGLLAVAVIVVFGWLLITSEQVEDMAPIAMEETETAAETGSVPPVSVEPSEAGAVQEPPAERAEPAPIVREKPARVAEQPAPAKQKKLAQAPAEKKQEEPAPEASPATKPDPVVQTFSDRLKVGGRGPVMVKLAAATYQMGSIGNSINFTEVPRHEVSLPVFSISRHEVTFDEYKRYARATGKRLPKDEGWGQGKQPVINVSWDDAQGYVEWLSGQTGKTYRLPTEAEWEYAARGGSEDNYWWAGVHSSIPANCFDCGSEWDGARTAPVGQFAANAYGLHDMAGNVQEWTADCYNANYNGAPADGSAWLTIECSARVVRGGAYSSPKDSLRSAKRVQMDQDTRLDNLGFRVVRVE